MRRRDFLAALAAATGTAATSTTAAGRLDAGTYEALSTSDGTIPELLFESSSSLLAADGTELTDSSVASVWLEDTATNEDSDSNGDATTYADATDVPVVATDGSVVGFGGNLVTDGTNWQRGNEEFLLNVWDVHAGGSGTILWDEGHSQYYDLAEFTEFESYAEGEGYDVRATTSLASDLSGADGAVITSPSDSFSNSELNALSDFVASGGALFLHDQADYSDYDETANLNDIAAALNLDFRFNDDQALDQVVNAGADYQPLTDEFNTNFAYFGDRSGLGLDPNATYTVSVTDVTDGDTVTVEFDDGSTESIRVLGHDTPEKSSNSQYERIQEWEGIEDSTYLENWADEATTFGQNELLGETVDLTFDDNQPVRDAFGRVLGYLWYDASGDGARDALYNYRVVQEGYARVYGSSFTRHESFWDAEADARANGRRVWTDSDPENSTEIRDRAVDDLFVPKPASVRTSSGAIADSRVPVYAETSASQDLSGGYAYDGAPPLVGVDETDRVAVVGGLVIDEGYEADEGYAVDTSDYENFVFLTNLIDYLSDRTGDVLIDGGHGQFAASFGLSNEDAAYYQRYLEGQGIGFEQVNTLTTSNLSRGRALIVSGATTDYTQSEVDAISSFVADGGAVIVLGCGRITGEARARLNDLAAGLGTDLRVNEDAVVDDTNNVNGDSDVPTTTSFDTSFPLFDAYTADDGSGGGELTVAEVHPDAQGSERDNPNDEYVVFENVGTESLDLTGWSVEDGAGYTYAFPDGFSLAVGATVTLHTGSGTDTATDIYWGRSSAVWNNSGDTVSAFDDQGAQVLSYTYSDANPLVSTGSASDVTDTSATLSGELTQLGSADSVDVAVEYRQTGSSAWATSSGQTLTSTGSFSESVSGLDPSTDYEFRAVADASDGQSDDGATATFTTGSGDSAPAVTTGSASNVTESGATLSGSLDDLGGASSADVGFEYRQTGASSWTATATKTLSGTGSYSRDVSGLDAGTEYEFRAVATASDGDTATGTTGAFTTDEGSTGDTAPAVDSYTVTEAGSNNPHAEITAEWTVSDADGDLDRVTVDVIDSSGSVVDSATNAASGGSDSGSEFFKIKKVRNETFDVTLTVTDAAGNAASATRTVTE